MPVIPWPWPSLQVLDRQLLFPAQKLSAQVLLDAQLFIHRIHRRVTTGSLLPNFHLPIEAGQLIFKCFHGRAGIIRTSNID